MLFYLRRLARKEKEEKNRFSIIIQSTYEGGFCRFLREAWCEQY